MILLQQNRDAAVAAEEVESDRGECAETELAKDIEPDEDDSPETEQTQEVEPDDGNSRATAPASELESVDDDSPPTEPAESNDLREDIRAEISNIMSKTPGNFVLHDVRESPQAW